MTNIQRIRKEKGISVTELSERSEVNIRMIRYYESGYKDINKAEALSVYKIANVLNCTVGDLLEL